MLQKYMQDAILPCKKVILNAVVILISTEIDTEVKNYW